MKGLTIAFTWLSAALIAVMVLVTAERAYASVRVPNATTATYDVSPRGGVLDFRLAATDVPVLVSFAGVEHFRGSALLTICQANAVNVSSLSWAGASTVASDGVTLGGFTRGGYGATPAGTLGYVAVNVELISGALRPPDVLSLLNRHNTIPAKIVVTQMW